MNKYIITGLFILTGLFLVAQNKSINWEKFRHFGSGLNQIGWLSPKSSKEIQSSSWSVGCETLDRDYADF